MPCAFCGHLSVTKGHVLPEWLSKVLPVPSAPLREVKAGYWAGSRGRHTPQLFTEQVRIVCQQRCNGGWMNQIEDAAKPVVTRLAQGQGGVVTALEQVVVARWAALVATMACYLQPKLPIPPEYPVEFYVAKEPPEITVVWLARFSEGTARPQSYRRTPQGIAWIEGPSAVDVPARSVLPQHADGYSITVSAGHLAFRVTAFRPPPGWGERSTSLRINLDLGGVSGVHAVWPQVADKIDWPSSGGLDSIGMSALASAPLGITARVG